MLQLVTIIQGRSFLFAPINEYDAYVQNVKAFKFVSCQADQRPKMKLCTFNKKVKNFSHACNPQIVNDMHIVHLKSEPIKGSLLLKNASELLEQLLSVSSILLCQEKGSINFHCGRTRKSAPPPRSEIMHECIPREIWCSAPFKLLLCRAVTKLCHVCSTFSPC